MSGRDLIDAVKSGNFEEVVRLVDEEHVDADSKDWVSFSFFKKEISIIFFSIFVCK